MKFEAHFGDQVKIVDISKPYGMGSDLYHLMVDNYYWGVLSKREGLWTFSGNAKDKLSSDDIQILGDIIESSNL